MKKIIAFSFIGVIILSGCHLLLPLGGPKEAPTTFFEGEYRGDIAFGAWGDYMEVKLKQPREGTEHGWLVHGTGRSYLKEKPTFGIEFMIDGHVTPDDLQKAELNLYKYELYFDISKQQFTKKGTIAPHYSVEATSNLKKLHLIIKDIYGNIQVDAELLAPSKILDGGA